MGMLGGYGLCDAMVVGGGTDSTGVISLARKLGTSSSEHLRTRMSWTCRQIGSRVRATRERMGTAGLSAA